MLIESDSVVGFLQAALVRATERSRGKKLTLAQLTKRGGFKSKGYVREILQGKRKLTLQASEGFSAMLELDAREASLLRLLLEVERKLPGAQAKLKKFKTAEKRRRGRKQETGEVAKLSLTPISLKVYAAVPSEGEGRSIAQLSRFLGLSESVTQSEIDHLVRGGLLRSDRGKLFTTDRHLVLNSAENTELLRTWFLSSIDQARDEALKDFQNPSNLYVTSHFSVSKKNTDRLAKLLRESVSQWIDQYQTEDGEELVTLSVSLVR